MQIIFFLSSLSLAAENEFTALSNYLEKIDKPSPGIEIFQTANSRVGYLCTYKEKIKEHTSFYRKEVNSLLDKHKDCKFFFNGTYFLNKDEFKPELMATISDLPMTIHNEYNYTIKSKDINDAFTISLVCLDCHDFKEQFKHNMQYVVRNRCK